MRRGRKARANTPNFVPSIDVESWMAENPDFLIKCPNQPGNLRLSKASCVKRHRTANEPRYATIGAEPFHIFVFKMNLVPCRNCEIGARISAQEAADAQVA